MIYVDSCLVIYAVERDDDVAWRAGCTAFWTNDARLAAASGGLALDVIGGG